MKCFLASSFLLGFIIRVEVLWAQPATAYQDSSLVAWSEAANYEIDRLRLMRWVRAHPDTSFLVPALKLRREADEFAKRNDYITAQLILDTALELASLRSAPTTVMVDSPAVHSITGPVSVSTPAWEWRPEVIFGVDLWRQEVELSQPEFDPSLASPSNLYVNRDGNPFIGLRINLNRNQAIPAHPFQVTTPQATGNSESSKLNFAAYAMLKSSRDYHSGELEFQAQHSLGEGAYWRLENRLEGTRYLRDIDLRYLQNTSSVLAAVEAGKNFRLEVSDEFRWRRYGEQSEFYPNYIQNQARLGAIFNSGYATRLDARYSYIVRAHDFCPADDYFEHRLDASIFQNTATNSSIFLENVWRNRIYPNNSPGSPCRNAYQNTYQEEYARLDLRLGLSESIGLRLEGDFTLRQHDVPSDSTPDFLNTTVNPQLQFRLFADLQISGGYLYLLRVHDKDIIQLKQLTAAAEPSYLFYEDYYSHGFTFGIDLIRTDGILLSLSEVYEVRTYPNATGKNIPYGLYTDRNINSLLLFFSWNFLSHWQASVLANFDNDQSRTDHQGDSRHTLFSLELGYSF